MIASVQLELQFDETFVVLQYKSTRMNQMFESGDVPYAWTNRVRASVALQMKDDAEAMWPEVTVTIAQS